MLLETLDCKLKYDIPVSSISSSESTLGFFPFIANIFRNDFFFFLLKLSLVTGLANLPPENKLGFRLDNKSHKYRKKSNICNHLNSFSFLCI